MKITKAFKFLNLWSGFFKKLKLGGVTINVDGVLTIGSKNITGFVDITVMNIKIFSASFTFTYEDKEIETTLVVCNIGIAFHNAFGNGVDSSEISDEEFSKLKEKYNKRISEKLGR